MNYRVFYFLLLNFVTTSASEAQDHYKILGVAKTATTAQVTQAYRKLAMEFHPDRNKSEGAEAIFKQINEAHQVLSDDAQHREYDNAQLPNFSGNNSNVHFGNSDSHKSFKAKSKAWEREHECSLFGKRSQAKPQYRDGDWIARYADDWYLRACKLNDAMEKTLESERAASEQNRNANSWKDTDSV